jgi:nucleoside-diphosphate-sugar epimerase
VPILCEEERLRPEKSEVNRLLADASLLRRLTPWTPQVGFADGLQRTVEWLRSHPDNLAPMRYTV